VNSVMRHNFISEAPFLSGLPAHGIDRLTVRADAFDVRRPRLNPREHQALSGPYNPRGAP
jgi:hypothetical protein